MNKKSWREKLNSLPKVLEEQIYLRCGLGTGAILIGAILLLTCGICFSLPWLLLAAYLLGGGIAMAWRCIAGGYTCIRGICEKIESGGFRKAPRNIVLIVDDIPMRVLLRRKNKLTIRPGDMVSVYSSDRTSVYLKDGYDYICSYYAMQVENREEARADSKTLAADE